ncbi:MAG: flagellar hook-associated protein FlgL [Deltaproteobacteria bacterium]|nr:flagellar hook-associated protein FlgL [Deltaproteobacteria bacterium]
MRISSKTIYDRINNSLQSTYSDMYNAQEVVSTSKRINKLSDDPVGLVSVLDLRSSISNVEQLGRNVSMGKTWLTASESALTQVNDILTDVKVLTVQMSSANTGASERANAAVVVDEYLDEIISLANSQSGGRYLFAGTNTDSAPFQLNETTGEVDYNGNTTDFSIKIGSGSNIAVGRVGSEIFGEGWDESNIFKTLVDLKGYLEANDISGIQDAMGNLDGHMTKINAEISGIGGKTVRMEVKENIIADLKLTYTDRKSQIEDADLAEATIELNAMQLAYNAALTSASKVMQLSLVDYIE